MISHHEEVVYLEVVSVSMKSQTYELPSQASVLLSSTSSDYKFQKQTKSILHLDAATTRQWWMFKEVFLFPVEVKEHRVGIKIYGSGSSSSSEASSSNYENQKLLDDSKKLKLPSGNSSRLEMCIGKIDVPLSSLNDGIAMTFDVSPVPLSQEKVGSLHKRSILSTISLRLLNEPPPHTGKSDVNRFAVCESGADDRVSDETVLGTLRLTLWQGKSLNTEYPVFLSTRMNQRTVRRYNTLPVANPHNPIFDVIQDFDIIALQGDLIVTVVTSHSLRSNKPLGQVIVPLSTLTKCMNEYGTTSSVSGWFELFPFNKITKYNGGGKYIPYLHNVPVGAGMENSFGLAIPERSIGFIKLDISLELHHSLIYTLVRNPFCVEEKIPVTGVDDDDAADLFDIYVMKHNFYRIMDTVTNPLWFRTLKDIIRWKHHFSVTFFLIYLYSYACLLADVWMFPAIFVVFMIYVGLVASFDRNFHRLKLFIGENVDILKQSKSKGDENSKSLVERYKEMKQSVNKMENKVRQLASNAERLNNLLLWSDPTLSITALFFLVAATVAASMVLAIIPINHCFFYGGLVVFIPQEAMGRLKKMKRVCELIFQRMKAEYRIRNDKVLPDGAFLSEMKGHLSEESMTGHILSGDLCSQTWNGRVHSPKLDDANGNKKTENFNSANWTRKWCELWASPGVLKITNQVSQGREENPSVLYDVTYVTAEYIGKSSKDPSSDASLADSSNDLYVFEIRYLKGKKAEVLRQSVWPDYQAFGWVFACSSYGDAQTWVKAINKVSYRVSSYRSILFGDDFHNPFKKRLNRSLLSMVVKTLWRWVMVVPDDLELQHRHFCELAYVRSKQRAWTTSALRAKPSEAMQNNDLDVLAVSSKKFMGNTEAVRYLTVGHNSVDVDDSTSDETITASSGIRVSLIRARSLGVKNTESKLKGWLLTTTIPKIYVTVRLSHREQCALEFRTGGQPRSSEPVFREDFFFPDVDYDSMLMQNVALVLTVSVRTPMAFGLSSDYVQILGRIKIPLMPWVEAKLAQTSNDPENVASRKVKIAPDCNLELEDERWFKLVSHSVTVGELKLQISLL